MGVVARGDDPALALVERRRAGEQGRRVSVGTEPEVHEVDRRCGPELGLVCDGGFVDREYRVVHRVDRAGERGVEEGDPGHPLVGVGIVHGDPAFVAEPDVDRGPVDVGGREQLVALAGRAPARQGHRRRRTLGDECCERLRYVVDDLHRSFHGGMI